MVAAPRSRPRVARTDTVSLLPFAVYTSSRRGFAAIAFGWSPVSGLVAADSDSCRTAAWRAVSITVTDRPSQLVTYALWPVRSKATPYGCWAVPRSITAVTPFVAGSITVTVRPGGLVVPAGP